VIGTRITISSGIDGSYPTVALQSRLQDEERREARARVLRWPCDSEHRGPKALTVSHCFRTNSRAWSGWNALVLLRFQSELI